MKKAYSILGWIIITILCLITGLVWCVLLGWLTFFSKYKKLSMNILGYWLFKYPGEFLRIWGLIYMVFTTKSLEKLERYFYVASYSYDQTANVMAGKLLNDNCTIKNSKYSYGDPDDTISEATGYIKQNKELVSQGIFLDNLMNVFDPDHSNRARESSIRNLKRKYKIISINPKPNKL